MVSNKAIQNSINHIINLMKPLKNTNEDKYLAILYFEKIKLLHSQKN